MKAGRTLQELAAELDRQNKVKRDFVASTKQLAAQAVNGSVALHVEGQEASFPLTRHAESQIATWAGVPQKYFDRMRDDAPGLLESNVNHWFSHTPGTRMVRTLDGDARAFLSNRYRRIDNYQVAEAVLPILNEIKDARIESCEVTGRKMYLKIITPRVQGDIAVGDPVQGGIVISNSEIGSGSVNVAPLIFRLVCKNGMVLPQYGTRKNHVGRNLEAGDEAYEAYTDETLEADDKALILKVRDTVRAAVEEVGFQRILQKMREAKGQRIEGDPVKAVEVLANRFTLNEGERAGVLRHLVDGGDLSRYGLLNAVTRQAQDVDDYDRASELERMGGQVLELPRSEWVELAEAA